MRTRHRIDAAIAAWVAALGLAAATARADLRALSIADAVDLALRSSPAAKRLALEEERARIATRASGRLRWPDLALDVRAPLLAQDFAVEPLPGTEIDTVRTPDGGTLLVQREVFGKTTTTRRNAAGDVRLRQLLPWRGTLTGDGSVFYRDEDTDPPGVRLGRNDTQVQAGVQLDLPLLGDDPDRRALRRAAQDAAAARSRARQARAELEFDVASRYLALLRARLALDAERIASEQAGTALGIVEQKVRSGLVAEVERMRIAVNRAERAARLAEAESEVARAADAFKAFLGVPVADSLVLAEPLSAFAVEPDADAAVRAALLRRTEIGLAASEIALLEADRRARRPRWPQLDVSMRYGGSASETRFDDALGALTANALSFAATLHVPLWDAGRAALADADERTSIALRRLDLEDLRTRIGLEVRDAVRSMQGAARRIELLEASSRTADELSRISGERYDRGLVDTTALLAAQADAASARLGRTQALLDLYQARARLQLLTLGGP